MIIIYQIKFFFKIYNILYRLYLKLQNKKMRKDLKVNIIDQLLQKKWEVFINAFILGINLMEKYFLLLRMKTKHFTEKIYNLLLIKFIFYKF